LNDHSKTDASAPLSKIKCPTCRAVIDVHPIETCENDGLAYQQIAYGAKGIMVRVGTLDAREYYPWKWSPLQVPSDISISKGIIFFFCLYAAAQLAFLCGAFVICTSVKGNGSPGYLGIEIGGLFLMTLAYHILVDSSAQYLLNCIRARYTSVLSIALAVGLHITSLSSSCLQVGASDTVIVVNLAASVVVILIGFFWVCTLFPVCTCTPDCVRDCSPHYYSDEDLCNVIPTGGIKLSFVPLHGHCKGWNIVTYILQTPKLDISILCARVGDDSPRRHPSEQQR